MDFFWISDFTKTIFTLNLYNSYTTVRGTLFNRDFAAVATIPPIEYGETSQRVAFILNIFHLSLFFIVPRVDNKISMFSMSFSSVASSQIVGFCLFSTV